MDGDSVHLSTVLIGVRTVPIAIVLLAVGTICKLQVGVADLLPQYVVSLRLLQGHRQVVVFDLLQDCDEMKKQSRW